MGKRIQKIIVKNFKGAAGVLELDLDSTKPIVMVFGENGSGKSTIVDAVQFVCNEEFGSLSDRSVGHSPAEYMATLGHPPADLEASITTTAGTWLGKIGYKSRPTTTGPAERPKAKVLRRSKILEIINAEPSGRYDAIRSFIEVPACEKNETALQEALRKAKAKYNDSVRAVDDARQALKKLWEKEGNTRGDYLTWGKSLAAKDHSALDAEITQYKIVFDVIARAIELQSTVTNAESELKNGSRELDSAIRSYEESKKQLIGDIESLIDVLEDAKEYFEANESAQTCPVCEQGIVAENLRNRISERLAKMTEQRVLRAKVQKLKRNVESRKGLLALQQKGFRDAAISLKNVIEKSKVAEVTVLSLNYGRYSNLVDPSSPVNDNSLREGTDIVAKVSGIAKNLSIRRDSIQAQRHQLNSTRNYLEIISSKTSIAQQDSETVLSLANFLKVAEEERKTFVDEILTNISGEVERLYIKLHPSEGIGKIHLYLNPQFHGSLEIQGQFQLTTDVPPQAYYSESHLDTLGVCIFLALAKYNNDDNTVVALDDVVTSVDQVHMERFYRMLNDEADNFNQILITTHFRPWRDKYRYYSGAGAKIQLIELQDWSLAKGVRHTKTKFSVDELNEAISAIPFDRQAVASKGGILLEGLLDRLTLQFKSKMARKGEDDYTLAEFAGGFSKDLKKLLRAEVKKVDGTISNVDITAKIVAGTDQTWVRSQVGAHFNISGMTISDSEVKDFGQRVVDLASALVCVGCGEFASRNKSGSYWECKCGNLKLFPLVAPS